jgi:hypothetical protein
MPPTETHQLVYHQVPTWHRHEYQDLVGNLTRELILNDVRSKFTQLGEIMFECGVTGADIDTREIEALSDYGISGDASSLLASRRPEITLCERVSRCMGLLELLSAFQEYSSGPGYSVPLIMLLNLCHARVQVDLERLRPGTAAGLSIHELSLLTSMQEGTLRNYAHPRHRNTLPTTTDGGGYTRVDPKIAHEWALQRRKYQPTTLPEDKKTRKLLADYFESWVNN